MKRFSAWFVLATAIAGCIQIGPGGSSGDSGSGGAGGTGGSSSSGSSSACDGKNNCDACRACAAQSACADELAVCQNNAACVGLDQCIQLCGADAECKQQCYLANSPGAEAFDAAARCLFCDACASDCKGYLSCSQ